MSHQVLLGLPCGSGQIPLATVTALLQLEKPCPCGVLGVERQRIDKCRNHFAASCLAGPWTHLLMCDDDNPPPPDALRLMLEDDVDIVGAAIVTRGAAALAAHYQAERPELPFRVYEPVTAFRDPGPLHRVDVVGTGLILIKRQVLESFQHHDPNVPPFEFGIQTINGQRRTMSEDAMFCERARDLGFSCWVDSRIRPIHLIGAQAVRWQAPVREEALCPTR